MAKYATATPKAATSAIRTKRKNAETLNYEGGQGFLRDPRSELFMLAVVNMGSENTYYETAVERDSRFRDLVHKVSRKHPEFIRGFIPYLRDEMNMRSASVVMAAEFVAATNGGPGAAEVVAAALSRADEPAEIIGYWHSQYGRSLPRAIKRGIEIAANRWDAYAVMKYDGNDRKIRLGDVIQLAHPRAKDENQSALFKYALDRRYGNVQDSYRNEMLDAAIRISKMKPEEVRALSSDELKAAGITWERFSSLGAMDKDAWTKVIPSMGYMALLRNLRNFEQAGVSKSVLRKVADRLADEGQVAKSRQFPYRFLSAYKALDSDTFKAALSDALDYSTKNLPVFDGQTLVLVDLSGSMDSFVSAKSQMKLWEIGALFGAALAKKNAGSVDFVAFASNNVAIPMTATRSVLGLIDDIDNGNGVSGPRSRYGYKYRYWLGGGTETFKALDQHYNGHKRVVIFSDMQAFSYGRRTAVVEKLKRNGTYVYSFNLGGYRTTHLASGKDRMYELGGFTDTTFKMIPLLERGGGDVRFPWEEDV